MKRQTAFPDWWMKLETTARTRAKILSLFSIHRDGYVRWYKGAPRFVASKNADPVQVENLWHAKRKKIDDTPLMIADPRTMTYREALSRYLTARKARIDAPKGRITERTYHNSVAALNRFGLFPMHEGVMADLLLQDIGPHEFAEYAAIMTDWSPSAIDSTICLIGAMFRWCVEMEYMTKYRPGPGFQRPTRQEMRDSRLGKEFSLSTAEIAAIYQAANYVMRCWIALGVCCAFNNSDIAHLTRSVIDLESGVIDFRRRKTGRVRRVVPLPPDVLELLNGYVRPRPAKEEDADLFFLSEKGRPFSVTKNANGKPSCTISRMTRKLMLDVKVKTSDDGRNFKSFRTSFFNLAPKGEYEIERKIVMGRAQGTIDLDSYMEGIALERLRHVVDHVWNPVKLEIEKLSSEHPNSDSASPATAPAVPTPDPVSVSEPDTSVQIQAIAP